MPTPNLTPRRLCAQMKAVLASNDAEQICRTAMKIMETEARYGDALPSPRAVRDYLRLHFRAYQHEVFVCLWMDAQHRVIGVEEMFRGTLTQTSVYPREVVKGALKANAACVIFAHNHPSGVAEPSHADEILTRCLKTALALVDVAVIDHFVVTDTATTSFSERGLL